MVLCLKGGRRQKRRQLQQEQSEDHLGGRRTPPNMAIRAQDGNREELGHKDGAEKMAYDGPENNEPKIQRQGGCCLLQQLLLLIVFAASRLGVASCPHRALPNNKGRGRVHELAEDDNQGVGEGSERIRNRAVEPLIIRRRSFC